MINKSKLKKKKKITKLIPRNLNILNGSSRPPYWSQRFFFFFPMREPRSGEKEKTLVALDLNLTFMQTPGSGSDPRVLIG